ncbi:eukaryotic translation initiation factor 4 gamma 1-like [Oratosquilla oratoria]|uniref:eukaryotic translation initiation factor 4 gamma 1-like n=1 Tax=Oratosquilla oratoria TaxID=337810 RepID=UPI003F7753C5
MNKLSAKNFKKISEQIKAFLAKHPGEVGTAAGIIVDFATRQQFYSQTYAQLSKILTESLGREQTKVFKARLLSECQSSFETRADNESLDNLPREERAEAELKKIACRKRYVSLCVFIGCLCLENLVLTSRVAYCAQVLLRRKDETSLEAVCALLQGMGKKMDEVAGTSPIAIQEVQKIYSSIKEIVDQRLTCSRLRYLLIDIQELRERNWQPKMPKN